MKNLYKDFCMERFKLSANFEVSQQETKAASDEEDDRKPILFVKCHNRINHAETFGEILGALAAAGTSLPTAFAILMQSTHPQATWSTADFADQRVNW